MARIASYRVSDFSGGVRRDKSPLELQKNELLDARNVEISERGRLITRRGSQQLGQDLTGTIENSFVFVPAPGGGTPSTVHMVNDNASTSVISYLASGARLSGAITTATTTITVDSGNGTAGFASSGVVEIEGDLINYTAKTPTTLTGVTGITSSHADGAAVNQWTTLSQSGTAVDAQMGLTYAVLNNICFICGRGGNIKQLSSGVIVTDVSSEPSILFVTNYRDRLYGAGDGGSGTNGAPVRVSYSNRGDGTTWTTGSDYFDVFDQTGEYITAFKVLNDRLGIFKVNSIFTYDEIELKQRVIGVGAYNHKVVKEINGKVYTFSPTGIYETNLYQANQIGNPVREYWENFRPQYDATGLRRVIVNTWAATFFDRYLLYIHDVTNPDSINDVCLEFNTTTRAWTVHTGGFTNFFSLNGFQSFRFGDQALTRRPALFGTAASGKVWRLYDNRWTDRDENNRGTDIFQDLISNTGSPVSVRIETPLYDLTYPELFKTFKHLRVLTESGLWSVEYRVENEIGIGPYRNLGTVVRPNQTLPFPSEAQGYRIGLRFSSIGTVDTNVFNGFVFENTEVRSRPNNG